MAKIVDKTDLEKRVLWLKPFPGLPIMRDNGFSLAPKKLPFGPVEMGVWRLGLALGLVALVAMFVFTGCLQRAPLGGLGEDQREWELPGDWADKVYGELIEKYPAKETKLFFIGRPRLSKLRYRYWVEKSYLGLAGLVMVRSLEEGRIFGGESGPWQVVYLIGPEGGVDFLSGRLEWIDVNPPLYALETVDQSRETNIRLSRPINLAEETELALKMFMLSPFEELTKPYVIVD
jgi:hypothetical protein